MRKFALVLAIGLFAAACSSSQENELSEALERIDQLEEQIAATTTTILRTGGPLNMNLTGYQGDYSSPPGSSGWLGCSFKGTPMHGSVWLTDNSWNADFSIYVTSNSWNADLTVYLTDYSWNAGR